MKYSERKGGVTLDITPLGKMEPHPSLATPAIRITRIIVWGNIRSWCGTKREQPIYKLNIRSVPDFPRWWCASPILATWRCWPNKFKIFSLNGVVKKVEKRRHEKPIHLVPKPSTFQMVGAFSWMTPKSRPKWGLSPNIHEKMGCFKGTRSKYIWSQRSTTPK